MEFVGDIGLFLLAQAEHGTTEEEGGGSFLVSPGLGLMLWTLVLFGVTTLFPYTMLFRSNRKSVV